MKFSTVYVFIRQEMPEETPDFVTEETIPATDCIALQGVMVGRVSRNKGQIFSGLNHFQSKTVSLPVKTRKQDSHLTL